MRIFYRLVVLSGVVACAMLAAAIESAPAQANWQLVANKSIKRCKAYSVTWVLTSGIPVRKTVCRIYR